MIGKNRTCLQYDAMDCGPACLKMIAKHYGRDYDMRFLRERCHVSRDGVSMLGICDAAEGIGLKATGIKTSWRSLAENVTLPCIAFIKQRHFIVLEKIKIEHTGKVKFITPFVGSQVDICRAFGFDIPDGCAPVYVSKAKPVTRKRGRPAKAKVENQKL